MTLVEFLRARLDEDERMATAASPWPWSPNAEHDEVVAVDGEVVCDGFALSTRQLRATVDHIARHDPSRVLAEISAKRAVLDLHTLTVEMRDDVPPFDPLTGKPNEAEYDVRCALCDWVSDNPTSGCATLHALAAPFADHLDFDPSWEVA